MHISLTNSEENGFKRWSDTHRPGNDDDTPGGATPIAVTEPPADDRGAVQEPPAQQESDGGNCNGAVHRSLASPPAESA